MVWLIIIGSGASRDAVRSWTSAGISPAALPDGTLPSTFKSKIGANFALQGYLPESPLFLKLSGAGYSSEAFGSNFCELPTHLNQPMAHEVKLRLGNSSHRGE